MHCVCIYQVKCVKKYRSNLISSCRFLVVGKLKTADVGLLSGIGLVLSDFLLDEAGPELQFPDLLFFHVGSTVGFFQLFG